MTQKPKISVIIPTFNSWRTLASSIESMMNQTLKPREIVIVDNASTDKTQNIVSQISATNKLNHIKLVYIRNPTNRGVTGGRNTGIDALAADSEYICFFDHDMVADSEMLAELYKTCVKITRIAIVTPKIYYWDKKDIVWSAGTDINLITGMNSFRNGFDEGQFRLDQEIAIAPAVLFLSKKVLTKLGKFDDRYFAVYEDTDYCYRAKELGFINYFSANAIAYHKIPYDYEMSMRRLVERMYWIGRNRTLFMKKYGKSYLGYLLISPIYVLYYSLLALRFGKVAYVFDYLKGFGRALWS